jgi:hypothetical protein
MPLASLRAARAATALAFAAAALCAVVALAPRALTSPPSPAVPQAAADTVRELPLSTNDIVYDPATKLIYASVPGQAPGGNSITPIDPAASAALAPVFVGSEPARLALSGDGQFIYAGINGAGAVRRFRVATRTPDLLFNLGTGIAADITVMPGNPHAVAVSRTNPGSSPGYAGVVLYDDGVPRPRTAGLDSASQGSGSVEFSASPALIYGSGGGRLQRIDVATDGLNISRSAALPSGDLKFLDGLLYAPTGQVINPETEQVVGTYDLEQPGFVGTPRLVFPDPEFDRVYFVVVEGGNYVLRVYQRSTFQFVGKLNVGVSSAFSASSLIRWGTHGLAYRLDNRVVLIQTPLVPSPAPFPAPIPSPTPAPTPTPVPTPAPGELRIVSLAANDLVVEPRTQTIYASVGSQVEAALLGPGGNRITAIDPASGAFGTSVPIGGEPNKMAVSEDGRFIYVGLDAENAVRRYDVDAQAPAGAAFSIRPPDSTQQWRARDLAVVPGRPGSVAVARAGSPFDAGAAAIYDDGVQRPGVDIYHGADVLEFSSNPSVLYGHSNSVGDYSFQRMVVAPCGVGAATSKPGLLGGFVSDFKLDNGLVYSTRGVVADPETGTRVGVLPVGTFVWSGAVLPDSKAGRVYFVTGGTGSENTLWVFDIRTFTLVGQLKLPGTSGDVSGLVRWGASGLAYRTSAHQVVIIQTPLVAPPAEPPTPAPAPVTPTLGLSGRITEFPPPFGGSPALEGLTVYLTGSQSATAAVGAGGTYSFTGLQPCGDYTVIPSAPLATFSPAGKTFNSLLWNQTVDFTASVRRFSLFAQPTVSESFGRFTVSVLRSGSTAEPASIDYATSDGTASERSDYTAAVGRLRFAPGESSNQVTIFVADDALAESPETLTLIFSNPDGATAPPATSVTLTINSNDNADGLSPVGESSFVSEFFVRQHYVDFLGREPDADGLTFWSGQTTTCGSPDPLVCRVNVSAAFFLSIEFQETGYLAYRTHGAAFGTRRVGNSVPLRLREFLADMRAIGAGVVVNQKGWEAKLESNKQAYFGEFVFRPSFLAQYPSSLPAAQFVGALDANAGGALTPAERDVLAAKLDSGEMSRGEVLRAVAENAAFAAREKNRAFVLMQYFGYLRRNPDDAPEPNRDYTGFNFWLGKLEEFGGNFVNAEMVKAFISSDEYRKRFGQ